MLYSALTALLVAYILSLFSFDDMFVQALKEWFGKDISVASYYILFFIVGLIAGLFGKEL